MKPLNLFKTFSILALLFISSLSLSARSFDKQLVYNPIEENGIMVGQTVYKMGDSGLSNYMKYSYKYDASKRMTESEAFKWNSNKNEWIKDLRIDYIYEGKTVTTNYYKWNNKENTYILAPEMTITMDNTNI